MCRYRNATCATSYIAGPPSKANAGTTFNGSTTPLSVFGTGAFELDEPTETELERRRRLGAR